MELRQIGQANHHHDKLDRLAPDASSGKGARRVEIEYTTLALADLGRLPPRFSDQITRKIERLRAGLVGDVKA